MAIEWKLEDDTTSYHFTCRKCNTSGHVEWREWESSDGGHEDYHYRCNFCNGSWWVEGIDS